MKRGYQTFVRFALMVALAFAFVLSPVAQFNAHTPFAPAEIAIPHDQFEDASDHGHSHEDVDASDDAFHGHVHNTADHDHNVAFLLPRARSGTPSPKNSHHEIALQKVLWGLVFDLDRPPRA